MVVNVFRNKHQNRPLVAVAVVEDSSVFRRTEVGIWGHCLKLRHSFQSQPDTIVSIFVFSPCLYGKAIATSVFFFLF